MQNIFGISRRWHDPILGSTRAIILILAVLAIELSIFLSKDLFPFSAIYLLGSARIAEVIILSTWGAWSFRTMGNPDIVKDAILVTSFFIVTGLLFLMVFERLSGSSILRSDREIIHLKGIPLIGFYLTSCLFSPAVEELFFRGILYRLLREKWNVWLSMGSISLVFGIIHLFFSGSSLVPFLGSLVFCIGYEKTKSILTPLLLHVTGNIIIFCAPYIKFL